MVVNSLTQEADCVAAHHDDLDDCYKITNLNMIQSDVNDYAVYKKMCSIEPGKYGLFH